VLAGVPARQREGFVDGTVEARGIHRHVVETDEDSNSQHEGLGIAFDGHRDASNWIVPPPPLITLSTQP